MTEHLLLPATDSSPPSFHHSRWGMPTMVWTYHDENGTVLGYICRYDTSDGKQIIPYTLWSTEKAPDGEWLRRSWPVPRPLYRLDLLAAYLLATIIICEGEKAADAAQQLLPLPDYVCITSPGGSNAAHKADWSAIRNRKVIIWPDNDAVGEKYALTVANILGAHNEVTILPLPVGKPAGWDAADALAEGWLHA